MADVKRGDPDRVDFPYRVHRFSSDKFRTSLLDRGPSLLDTIPWIFCRFHVHLSSVKYKQPFSVIRMTTRIFVQYAQTPARRKFASRAVHLGAVVNKLWDMCSNFIPLL